MKTHSRYVCQNCGATSARWVGKCSVCGAWETYVEEIVGGGAAKNKQKAHGASSVMKLSDIAGAGNTRILTGIDELDRVLGGGITPGSLILVGGDPGIGKSTLMLQLCAGLRRHNPLYITGEESLYQIKQRAARLTTIPDDLLLLAETNISTMLQAIKDTQATVAIIDSIQTTYHEDINSTPGTVTQVRECTALLMQAAKKSGTAIFLVGHVTKDGMIAGPKVLEHMVDTVLQFEGEKTYAYRLLRAIKNRYGSTNEIGIFEMVEGGLKEVNNPSEIFLAQRHRHDSGTAIVATVEGTRPMLIEVQALVSPTGFSVAQRTSTGFDTRRLQMILAVLEKRLGLEFRKCDVFVNVAGGVTLDDPAVDLGIAAALVSSWKDVPLHPETVLIGEIGLSGEIRPVSHFEQRCSEAEKLGFTTIIAPSANTAKLSKGLGIACRSVERVSLALTALFT